jgi:hypothetical protein
VEEAGTMCVRFNGGERGGLGVSCPEGAAAVAAAAACARNLFRTSGGVVAGSWWPSSWYGRMKPCRRSSSKSGGVCVLVRAKSRVRFTEERVDAVRAEEEGGFTDREEIAVSTAVVEVEGRGGGGRAC